MRFERGRWRCVGCEWSLPAEVAGRTLAHAELQALLDQGRTARLYGFQQSSGRPFKASLLLDEALTVRLDFEGGEEPPLPPGATPPAFGQRVDCPLCLNALKTDPGYIVRGQSAWGCSAWREGCKLRVPFVLDGRQLDDADAQRLVGRQHATRYLEGFVGPRAAGRPCRLVIDFDAEAGWRLEPKARR